VLTESSINGFPSAGIEAEFRKDPYRFLVVADKFQTGYDEPLLHTLYVDKLLTDIIAVQTLSRLNRACPGKHDTFVLDFANEADTIVEAFSRYYRTTILSAETDPNKLYDLIATMENFEVYTASQVDALAALYLQGAERDKLDPILDACLPRYKALDEAGQVAFKGAAKGFVRTYGFLGAILPIGNAEWEKLSILLQLLVPKLPSPVEEDLSQGILEAIDLDSYRPEAGKTIALALEDADAESDPVPTGALHGKPEPEMDWLTNILASFNEMFGDIEWSDADNVRRQIAAIPAMVFKNEKYQNAMKNSDQQNARMESDRALSSVMDSIMSDNMELFKQFADNPYFKKWLSDMVFSQTYRAAA
jgi:type I restriction enzyme R subunit